MRSTATTAVGKNTHYETASGFCTLQGKGEIQRSQDTYSQIKKPYSIYHKKSIIKTDVHICETFYYMFASLHTYKVKICLGLVLK